MADAGRSEHPHRLAATAVDGWRRLSGEQRLAGVAALALIVSTFGPFSPIEAVIVLTGIAVLALLRGRARGESFHVPFGDGAAIAAAGAWAGTLIVVRIPDRPLGQGLLALACAALLAIAGLRERVRRPSDEEDISRWEEPPPNRRRRRRARAERSPFDEPQLGDSLGEPPEFEPGEGRRTRRPGGSG